MCGIAGILSLDGRSPPPDFHELATMASALRHRGPDEFGAYRDRRIGLAHARLSIIDLSTGQQPLANEDEALWIVFNGEIFNYVELRDELSSLGHVFRTRSDTEVIVHAYEQWGNDAFPRFNGQWALALWNNRERRLVLSRDRLGIRPLYYCQHAGRLLFASEVKAIFTADASIPRALDPTGLDETFTFWSIVPPQSVFSGVYELEPGHVQSWQDGVVRDHAYWTPSYEPRFLGSLDEAAEAVCAQLLEATRLRMLRADVPVGSYLSGGLDSSLVAAMGHEAKQEGFRTFSLRFADSEYDETDYQRTMAELLGSEHQEVMVRREDIAEIFPDVVFHTERPILRTAPAPLFLLSRLVRQAGIKVVLTGEGADEMFAGYDLFREAKVRRFWARHPESTLRPRLLERLYPYLARSPVAQRAITQQFFGRGLHAHRQPGFSHAPRWQSAAALKRLFTEEFRRSGAVEHLLGGLPGEFAGWSPLAQDQYLEVRTLLSGYLLSSQGDRMLMANSVEGRFPFLDKNVVELANSLPASYKLRVLDEKHVLKRASVGRVPLAIRARKKQPYRAPDAAAFAKGPDWIRDVLDETALKSAGVFDPRAVTQLWTKCQSRGESGTFSNADNMAVTGVLSTQLLHRFFVSERPRFEPVHFLTQRDLS
jgi:asparagine synthase (glutamine-hydrolysing)